MNGQVDPLAELRDIHLPADPGWWPPAAGWWLGLLLAVAGLAWALPKIRGYLRSRRMRRELERRLGSISWGDTGESRARALADLSRLVRRYAVTRFGRQRVAGLCGDDWLAFLDRTSGTEEFTRGPGRVLAEGPYRRVFDDPGPDTLESLERCVVHWARACQGVGRKT